MADTVRRTHLLRNQAGLKSTRAGMSQTRLHGFIVSSEEVVGQETRPFRERN